MATTTASFSLASGDIASSPVSVSASTTLYKAGLTTGVDQIQGMSRRILKSSETGKTLLKRLVGRFLSITSPTLANLGVNAGMIAYGTGIADGTTVGSITDADTLELSSNDASTSAISADDGTIAFFERATVNKANKVYICNSSTSDTDFVVITINQEEIGRLYAGDWMFMPWSVSDLDSEIYVTAATQTTAVIIDYMVVGEGNAA